MPKRKVNPKVKTSGDTILYIVRAMLERESNNDRDLLFKINRWVFARLQGDERQNKGPIKKLLYRMGMTSCTCGAEFKTLKNIELHRKDEELGYSITNCLLLCRKCHVDISRKTSK